MVFELVLGIVSIELELLGFESVVDVELCVVSIGVVGFGVVTVDAVPGVVPTVDEVLGLADRSIVGWVLGSVVVVDVDEGLAASVLCACA